MNFLALLLGLTVERMLAHLLHLRSHGLLAAIISAILSPLSALRLGPWVNIITMLLVMIAPVAALQWWLGGALHGLPGMVFAVVVLVYVLGPDDLESQVDDYLAALEVDDRAEADRIGAELLESALPEEAEARTIALIEAILIQANNRLFSIIFWFALLGPAGAWAMRVTDIARLRLLEEAPDGTAARVAALIHGFATWLPSRLLAIGYALAGSFQDAVAAWRAFYEVARGHFLEVNNALIACAGCGALKLGAGSDEPRALREALGLVSRTLVIWLVVIALMTLTGVLV
jgi:membrane protein required for beta-lactamase induction